MGQILPGHDLAEAHRRGEKKLHTAAISSKIVVRKIGQQEQRVGSAERKC